MQPTALLLVAASLFSQAQAQGNSNQTPSTALPSTKLVDLDGDGNLDRLISDPDRGWRIALNRGQRVFELIPEALPVPEVSDVLATDLDGDGFPDLYLVTPGRNVALLGDGTGAFVERTSELGLEDRGEGVFAELSDLDGDGVPDLVLHNRSGDVLFWGRETGGFERDPSTPEVLADPTVAVTTNAPMAGMAGTPVPDGTPAGKPRAANGPLPATPPASPGLSGGPLASPPTPKHHRIAATTGALNPAGPAVSTAIQIAGAALTPEQRWILGHMSRVQLPDGQGGTTDTIRISGANLQIVSGAGATNGFASDPTTIDPNFTTTNGLGNLIIGYNELGNPNFDDRRGSHNLVIGTLNNYTSFGGLVASRRSSITGAFASVTGGFTNIASGTYSSICGGEYNGVSANASAILGGIGNTASARISTVSGGVFNQATAVGSSVGGGRSNLASGVYSSILGGQDNTASGMNASVVGGRSNVAQGSGSTISAGLKGLASGRYASVSAGFSNQATGSYSSVSGGTRGVSGGTYASVSGGYGNRAADKSASVSGGMLNTASGTYSSVSGGFVRSAPASRNWAAGKLFQSY